MRPFRGLEIIDRDDFTMSKYDSSASNKVVSIEPKMHGQFRQLSQIFSVSTSFSLFQSFLHLTHRTLEASNLPIDLLQVDISSSDKERFKFDCYILA